MSITHYISISWFIFFYTQQKKEKLLKNYTPVEKNHFFLHKLFAYG